MTLTTEILERILSSQGVKKRDRIILGFSGGADSVVLAHLLHLANHMVEFAHVNYGLRGEESQGDELFVRRLADEYQVKLHVLRPDAAELFGEQKSAVQQKARELRYAWFHELRNQQEADWIFVAHHQSDQAETILHQFIRGGALKSLTGMAPVHGFVIRPLLDFSSSEIRAYASKNNLNWRNDSSNETNAYTRNYIRHEIIPMLTKMNASFESVIAERGRMLQRASDYMDEKLDEDIERFMQDESGQRLSLNVSADSKFPDLLLWHWLQPFGLSSDAMPEVVNLLSSQTGSHIDFGNWVLWKEHDALFLKERSEFQTLPEVILTCPGVVAEIPGLIISEASATEVVFSRNNATMFIDASAVDWPITVRSWRIGDRFVPLGFGHEKKLSDFFMHEKIAVHQRHRFPVLLSSQKIIAIAGLRMDDAVRITPSSKHILRIDFKLAQ
jgi:tRNA(Ile)-lysidine synthase